MTLEELKEVNPRTNETRWAIHLLESMGKDQLEEIIKIIRKILDK